jgi:hypothetical protein
MADRYRKKPLVVEAWRFDTRELFRDWPDWVHNGWLHEDIITEPSGKQRRGSPCLLIPTPEGAMRANPGDWIIRGVKGEVYPCKPDVFETTYERA